MGEYAGSIAKRRRDTTRRVFGSSILQIPTVPGALYGP